jgi:hypothetical protein
MKSPQLYHELDCFTCGLSTCQGMILNLLLIYPYLTFSECHQIPDGKPENNGEVAHASVGIDDAPGK